MKKYNYIAGYTNIQNGETFFSEINYETFTSEMLSELFINPILEKEKDCVVEWNSDHTSAKLIKKIIQVGYIYNSKKYKTIYNFFFSRVYTEGNSPLDEIRDGDEDEKSIIEELPKVIAPAVDFLSELKTRLINRRQSLPIDIPVPAVKKTEFLEELEQEINMRNVRARKRLRKLEKKRERRRVSIA